MTPPTTDPTCRVAVIGLGYIGLPTAAILATHGAEVIGVDVNASVVEAVNRGEVPFVEPDLEIAVAGAVAQGRLTAQLEVPEADVFVVAVPTPVLDDHSADLGYVEQAGDALAPQLHGGELVILESTSPPGSTRLLAERVLAARPDLSLDGADGRPVVHFAHCPERVLPGRVMVELVTNDRIVGGLTGEAADRAADLYALFCKGELMRTDATTAELSKLVENAYRDVNIAFANEVAVVAESLGVEPRQLIALANRHPRVDILSPGPGVGGHCIAVDPWFIVAAAPQEAQLIRTARHVNDAMPGRVVDSVVAAVADLPSPRIAALGLAFKADIDDLRSSPAVEVVTALSERLPGARIAAVEPHIEKLPASLAALPNVALEDLDQAIAPGVDLVVLLVDHQVFRAVDHREVRSRAKVIDTRGLWHERRRAVAER